VTRIPGEHDKEWSVSDREGPEAWVYPYAQDLTLGAKERPPGWAECPCDSLCRSS
jgi:hypothetical protein